MKHISFPKVKTEKRATTYTTASPMSNDKTAEEILSKYETYVRHTDVPIFLAENAIKAMHDYSAQQLKEYKDVIRELFPYVNNRISVDLPDWEKKLESLMSLLNRANKLIDQTDSTK